MKKIKIGDEIVPINPQFAFVGEIRVATNIWGKMTGLGKCRLEQRQRPNSAPARIHYDWDSYGDFCLRPSKEQEIKVGDWVLPVLLPTAVGYENDWDSIREQLLKPVKIKIPKYNTARGLFSLSVMDNEFGFWDWPTDCVAKIEMSVDNYIIGDSCRISHDEFEKRYGCRPGYTERKEVHIITGPKWQQRVQREHNLEQSEVHDHLPTRWKPTYQDYAECCGVWYNKAYDNIKIITPDGGDGINYIPGGLGILTKYVKEVYYNSREDFDRDLPQSGYERIEPIPPQCIPGYEEPGPEPVAEWKRDAVEKYPYGLMEWD